ncbi:MAG: hypothetical protein V7765_05430 [Oleispira sp.]
MSLLIFQITIKQWDKGQNSTTHQNARNALPSVFPITAKPTLSIFNCECILDQHGDDIVTNVFSHGRIRAAVSSPDRVKFDRFEIVNSPTGLVLEYSDKGQGLGNGESPNIQVLGPLNEQWIQARYNWRYSVLESNQIYWMYEEVTLNAMCVEAFDSHAFLKTEPRIVFNDIGS